MSASDEGCRELIRCPQCEHLMERESACPVCVRLERVALGTQDVLAEDVDLPGAESL